MALTTYATQLQDHRALSMKSSTDVCDSASPGKDGRETCSFSLSALSCEAHFADILAPCHWVSVFILRILWCWDTADVCLVVVELSLRFNATTVHFLHRVIFCPLASKGSQTRAVSANGPQAGLDTPMCVLALL